MNKKSNPIEEIYKSNIVSGRDIPGGVPKCILVLYEQPLPRNYWAQVSRLLQFQRN